MKRYEYERLFETLSEGEKVENWRLFRDNRGKVNNTQREFHTEVRRYEEFSNHKWTMRTGGQDLRSKQLSVIRIICAILEIDTIHGNHKLVLSEDSVKKVKDYVWQKRVALSELFEFTLHITTQGTPYHWLQRSTIRKISRDPKLYVLNQVMRAWGFARIVNTRGDWVPLSKCPFTLKNSTKARCIELKENFPQYYGIFTKEPTMNVAQRKRVIRTCQNM